MRSQFLDISRFRERRSERGRGRGRRRGRGRGRGRGRYSLRGRYNGYIQKPIVMNKSPTKAATKYCDLCKLKCNSISQWEQHINGYAHRARLMGDETPKRTNKTYVRREEAKNSSEKSPKRINGISQRSSEEEVYNKRKEKQNKTPFSDRRPSSGKRQPAASLICKLCDTKCNGKVQYAGHINGKQHQMALERRRKQLTTKSEGEV